MKNHCEEHTSDDFQSAQPETVSMQGGTVIADCVTALPLFFHFFTPINRCVL